MSDNDIRIETEPNDSGATIFSLKAALAQQQARARDLEIRLQEQSRLAAERAAHLDKLLTSRGMRLLIRYGVIKIWLLSLLPRSIARTLRPLYTRLLGGHPYKASSRPPALASDGIATIWFRIMKILRLPPSLFGRNRPVTPASSGDLASEFGTVSLPATAESASNASTWFGQVTVLEPGETNQPHGEAHLDVICFPVNPWGFRFQRTEQLLHQFELRNHRIFFIEPKFVNVAVRSPERLTKNDVKISEVRRNLYVVELAAGRELNIYQDAPSELDLGYLTQSLRILVSRMQVSEAVCLVSFPFWTKLAFWLSRTFNHRVIYDCMDDWAGFGNISLSVLGEEQSLVSHGDLCMVSSKYLLDKYSTAARRIIFIQNAADFHHFHRLPQNTLLHDLPKPILGYYGAIAEWFDVDLIEHVATCRPNWSIVLIGRVSTSEAQRLRRFSNIHFCDEQAYADLPKYLFHFDVCLIPFRLNSLTEATNPVKFYEYLSTGKPIVATCLPELEPYRSLVYLASGPDEFLARIEQALTENYAVASAARTKAARENTWRHRFQQLYNAIEAGYPKASVIIVTHNNLSHTIRCLESVFQFTHYPNYEVIIVDNASTDGTQEYLQHIENECGRVTVMLNSANHGFAAANNQGMELATGDYFVFLNNDTVVTRGWLSGLIRHLQDPTVGLVGPVTNSIGNEAKIEVPYGSDLDAMHRFAWDYTELHRGEALDIGVLALFCAATRRDVIEKVGVLDVGFGLGFFEDDDFCRRIRMAELRVICCEDVFIHHFGGASFEKLDPTTRESLFTRNRVYFERKWGVAWIPHRYREAGNRLMTLPQEYLENHEVVPEARDLS